MFSQSQQLTTKHHNQICGITELQSIFVPCGNGNLGFLLLTRHDEKFCGRMNDIDFFENGRRVVRQGLLPEMVYNEFETTVRAERCPYNLSEFMDSMDIA